MDTVSVMSWDRAFAVTRVISAGSSRGMTAARATPYAFCSTSTPNAAGSSVTGLLIAADMPQQSRPRASRVPASRNLRPCCIRSRAGPMNGASTANGAMVTSRNSTTRPRAWSTDVLKKMVPASDTATNASPAPLAAVSSMRVDRPVRPAPEAPVTRCTRPPVRRPALAPARAPDRTAPPVARAAVPVRRIASDSRMYPVFLTTASAATRALGALRGLSTRLVMAG